MSKSVQQIVMLSQKKTRISGVSLYDVYRLLVVAGFAVTSIDKANLEIYVNFDGNLMAELTKRIRDNEGLKTPNPNLKAAATFAYIITNGSNFDEIIWRDDVDLYRSHPINSHDVKDLLGIDAARMYLIDQFNRTLRSFSSYINVRHIELIFDLLTNLGLVNSLTFSGVNRRALGPLAAASYSRAMDVFANASIFGTVDAVANVSSNMYTGQQSKQIGTGAVGIISDNLPIPADKVGLPPSEQVIEGNVLIDELGTEEPGLAQLIAGEASLFEKAILESNKKLGAVDKTNILRTSSIVNTAPSSDVYPDVIPTGAKITTPSKALMSALNKVTANANFEFVEPKVPEEADISGLGTITNVDDLDLSDLVIYDDKRAKPSIDQPFDVLGTLREPISEIRMSATDARQSLVTAIGGGRAVPVMGASTPQQPVTLGVPSPQVVPSTISKAVPLLTPTTIAVKARPPPQRRTNPGATILDLPLPEPIAAPELPIPVPPRSNIVPAAPITFDISSFISELPSVEVTRLQPVAQNKVSLINYDTFTAALK